MTENIPSSSSLAIPATTVTDSISGTELDLKKNERFHLFPKDRIEALTSTGALVGVMIGFYEGVKKSAARYLVENAHRLPTTKGGWYFYHKRKNYEMIVGGMSSGIKTGVTFGGFLAALSLLEYSLDFARGQIDFINTTVSCFIGTGLYTRYKQLNIIPARKMVIRGTIAGLLLGLVEDAMINARSGKVWYIEELKKRFR
ncbi:hypothetical protein KGF56_002359 [Candida oxycetoniae]|uniref:Uncharacterized protein n=1 Tax=Candida oxycetoniae TaxID=497107 RepID=A0AAI9SY12_9ASCO|nr:uncharacterized protein KGF56_002359 [Candida oxycetoniae]KAI3404842.2 hypothetical protein KGF56_002359 [Candida oxycetoniae]